MIRTIEHTNVERAWSILYIVLQISYNTYILILWNPEQALPDAAMQGCRCSWSGKSEIKVGHTPVLRMLIGQYPAMRVFVFTGAADSALPTFPARHLTGT